MKLYEFLSSSENLLDQFAVYWFFENHNNKEDYPLDLEPGQWAEMLAVFVSNQMDEFSCLDDIEKFCEALPED